MKAFVFPGQGSQYVGMGRDLVAAYPEARAIFERADEVLAFPLSRLCFEGPEHELTLTENTQPAILTLSVALWRTLVCRGNLPDFVAGHSLGEYSALVVSGALEFEDAVRLVRERGRLMQKAVPVGQGAMAAILGLERGAVEEICREAAAGEVVSPANINAPLQIVIAGHRGAVERAGELARQRGAGRVVPLPVSAPFHCSLMRPAQEGLAEILAEVNFKDLAIPLVSNVDAEVVVDGEAAREALIRQVSSAVLWTDSVTRLAEEGVSTFVEVGPGRILSGLIRKILPEAEVMNLETKEQVEAYV